MQCNAMTAMTEVITTLMRSFIHKGHQFFVDSWYILQNVKRPLKAVGQARPTIAVLIPGSVVGICKMGLKL